MKTFTTTFEIIEKKVRNYDTGFDVTISYNPKFNDEMMKAIRTIFERGPCGNFRNFAKFFDIKENKMDKEFTVETDIDMEFGDEEIAVYANIIPMRQKNYAKMSMVIKVKNKEI